MDVRNDTTTGDCSLDEGIQFLIAANRKLQVAGSNTFDLKDCLDQTRISHNAIIVP